MKWTVYCPVCDTTATSGYPEPVKRLAKQHKKETGHKVTVTGQTEEKRDKPYRALVVTTM